MSLPEKIERIIGENKFMGYEGDIAEFWESVRDHGWGSCEDEARKLIEDCRQVLVDCLERITAP